MKVQLVWIFYSISSILFPKKQKIINWKICFLLLFGWLTEGSSVTILIDFEFVSLLFSFDKFIFFFVVVVVWMCASLYKKPVVDKEVSKPDVKLSFRGQYQTDKKGETFSWYKWNSGLRRDKTDFGDHFFKLIVYWSFLMHK